jgi:hypothetical protein
MIADLLTRFLLAQLHFELLAMKQNRKSIRLALMHLPKELDQTYEEAIRRIDSQNEDDSLLARRALSWIVFAKRAMTVSELRHAIAVEGLEANENELNDDGLVEEDLLVAVCAGIVIVDNESQIIRLIHYSTQEYFNRLRDSIFPDARRALTNSCLRYLSLKSFVEGSCLTDQHLQQRLVEYPFFMYAALHWGDHARDVLGYGCLDVIISFIKKNNLRQAVIQVTAVAEHGFHCWSQRYPRNVPALVHTASFGLDLAMNELLRSNSNVECCGSDLRTALMAAAENGHETTVTLLLDHGALQNVQKSGGETALALAAGNGHGSVVTRLIGAGSKINLAADDGCKPTDFLILLPICLRIRRILEYITDRCYSRDTTYDCCT